MYFVAYDADEACWYRMTVTGQPHEWKAWVDECLDYDLGLTSPNQLPEANTASLGDGTCVATHHRLDADCWPEDPDILPCSESTYASCCDDGPLPDLSCDPQVREPELE